MTHQGEAMDRIEIYRAAVVIYCAAFTTRKLDEYKSDRIPTLTYDEAIAEAEALAKVFGEGANDDDSR
jgi:hypothetical protein